MSIQASVDIVVQHAVTCGATRAWEDCNCGHFGGWDKPVVGPRHGDNCPCRCTCNFGQLLAEIVKITPAHQEPKMNASLKFAVCLIVCASIGALVYIFFLAQK